MQNKSSMNTEDFLKILAINKEINSETQLEKLLKKIIDVACESMDSQLCSIMLLHSEGYLTIAASNGIPDDIRKNIKVQIGDGISGWVAKHKKSLLIEDIETDERLITKSGNYRKDKYSTPSFLSVPVFYRNELIGVFNINNKKENMIYSDRDRLFLEALAEQAAISIKNAEYYERMQKQQEELEVMNADLEESTLALSEYTEELYTLHEITKIIAQRVSSYSDWDELIREILDLFFSIEVLSPDEIILFLLEGGRWRVENIRKILADFTGIISLPQNTYDVDTLARFIEVCEHSSENNEIIRLPEDDERFDDFYQFFKNIYSSVMFGPLRNKEGPLGVIVLGRFSDREYTEKNRNLLSVIDVQIATALSLGRAYDEEVKAKVLEKELQVAHDIQKKLLPKRFPEISGIDISGLNIPAKSVGGDYYDVIIHNDGKIGIVVADVSGKGIPAALIMTMVRSYITSEVKRGATSPLKILDTVNDLIVHDIEGDRYVTMFYGVIDPMSMQLTYAKAGHNPPLIVHRDGSVDSLEARGLFIGMFEDGLYEENSFQLEDGDKIVLFTDGITEAMNIEMEEFGNDAFKEVLCESRDLLAHDVVKEVRKKIGEFVGDAPQHDDITILVLNVDKDLGNIIFREFSSTRESIEEYLEFVDEVLAEKNITDSQITFTVKLLVDELFCNAAEHGNKFNPKKKVKTELIVTDNFIKATFEDEGMGFDWRRKMSSTSRNLLSERGRGILVCSNAAHNLEYNEEGTKSAFTLYMNRETE